MSQVFRDNKGRSGQNCPLNCTTLSGTSNDGFRADELVQRSLHIAYGFGHRVLPMSARTSLGQVIKRHLTRTGG